MKKEIMEAIGKKLEELAQDGKKLVLMDVKKNNGMVKTAVSIFSPGSVRPMVYVDEIVWEAENSYISTDEAARRIMDLFTDLTAQTDPGILPDLTKESVLQNVYRVLVNAGKNRELLKTCPHEEHMDLAVMYRAVWNRGEMSMLITNGTMEAFDITEAELKQAADKNEAGGWFSVKSLGTVFEENFSSMPQPEFEGNIMFIATNRIMRYGAAVMLHPELFRGLAEKLQQNLYILPSSIHEVIVVPENVDNAKEFKRMVKEVNATQVAPEEVLGGSVYLYSRETGEISIAA